MAKVTGPLYSMAASGKLGNALVYFPWKGLNIVRKWVIPSNPQTIAQGENRLIFGGLGRATRVVATGSVYHTSAVAVASPGRTWVGEFISYMMNNVLTDLNALTAVKGLFTAHLSESAFESLGAQMQLAGFSIPYDGTTIVITPGFMLYLLAMYGVAKADAVPNAFSQPMFDKPINTWTDGDIGSLQVNMMVQ